MANFKRTTQRAPLTFIACEFGTASVYLATAHGDIRRALRIHAGALLERRDLLARISAREIESVKVFAKRAASFAQRDGRAAP